MATIPSRNDVLKRLEKSEVQAIQSANDRIARLLIDTMEIPLTVPALTLGLTHNVQEIIVQRLKQAGYTVQFDPNDKEDLSKYTIK